MNHERIQQPLLELLSKTKEITGKSAIVIGHSLGGMLVETFMKINKDWAKFIHHFIAIGVPFEGASAYTPQSHLLGYALRLKCPDISAKGC